MTPQNVNPNDWTLTKVIFEDPETTYSAIFGYFRGTKSCLGLRWNGQNGHDSGYPGQANYPLWFVIPDDLTYSTLNNLLKLSIEKKLINEDGTFYADLIFEVLKTNISDDYTAYLWGLRKFGN